MNTKFSYMYRDAANYKTFYDFVFEGEISSVQLKRFEEICNDEDFIPHAIGLAGGAFPGEDGYDAELDHYWCEHDFEDSFELVDAAPNLLNFNGVMGTVKIDSFLEAFEKCSKNWEVALANPVNLLDFNAVDRDVSLSTLIQSAEKEADLHGETVRVLLTKDEIELVKRSLNEVGDRVADREGYSSGEKYWDLKQKLESLEGRFQEAER